MMMIFVGFYSSTIQIITSKFPNLTSGPTSGIVKTSAGGSLFELKYKVERVFPMVVVSILPHAEFGPNDHREDAPHFK